MIPFRLKKWYFDLVGPEGDALYFYFITVRVAGIAQGHVSAHLITGDGREVRASEKTPFGAEAAGSLKLGRHAFVLRERRVEARLEFKNLSLDLAYTPQLGPWWPTKGGVLLTRNGRVPRGLRWHVPVPSARVEGIMAVPGDRRPAAGTGYLDVVETDIPPWKLPLAELLWGRAHFPGRTVVFNQVKTRRGELIRNLLLAESRPGPVFGQQPAFDEQSFTLRTGLDGGSTSLGRDGTFGLFLTGPRVIEDSPVVTAERFKPGSLRRFLDRLTGRPWEKKMVSRARLEFDGKTVSGTALHERVSWHWPEARNP